MPQQYESNEEKVAEQGTSYSDLEGLFNDLLLEESEKLNLLNYANTTKVGLAAGAVLLLFFALFFFFTGEAEPLKIITLGSAGLAFLLLSIYYNSTGNYRNSVTAGLAIGVLLYLYLFIEGGVNNTALFWFPIFPSLAFALSGTRNGIKWILVFMLAIYLATMADYLGFVNLPYDFVSIRQFIFSFLSIIVIDFMFEYNLEKREKFIRGRNETLKELNQVLKKEISFEKRVEGQLSNALKDAQEKNKIINQAETKLKEAYAEVELERQKHESHAVRLEALLDSIGDGVQAIDKNGKIIFFNRSASRMLGIKQSEAIGKKADEVIKAIGNVSKGQTLALDKPPIWWGVNTGHKTKQNYYYTSVADGTRFPVSVTVTPVKLGSEVVGAVEVFRDITKDKAVSQAKSEFVSLASHQLRTPLSTVSWYIEMLKETNPESISEEQKGFIQEIEIANQRMISLVDSLLNVSRIELGTFAIQPKDVDPKQLLEESLLHLDTLIKEKGLEIVRQVEENIPLLKLDPKLTQIIFENILNNAVKYTPAGGKITINLKFAKPEQEDKEMLQYAVSDTGYGIPEDEQDKIFNRLFRASNIRTKDTTGTGLGLYIVKMIMEQIKGKIWFESEQNQGSTFYVNIPASGMSEKKGDEELS